MWMLVFTLLPLLALAYDAPGSGESVTFTEYPNLFIFPLNSLVISEIIRNFATVLLTS